MLLLVGAIVAASLNGSYCASTNGPYSGLLGSLDSLNMDKLLDGSWRVFVVVAEVLDIVVVVVIPLLLLC